MARMAEEEADALDELKIGIAITELGIQDTDRASATSPPFLLPVPHFPREMLVFSPKTGILRVWTSKQRPF